MRSLKNKIQYTSTGMTLIEVIIYTVLLSVLMTGFIQYSYSVHVQNIQLIHSIEDAEN